MDSAGRRLRLNDERMVHVLLADLPRVTYRMVANFYGRFGWRTVISPERSHEILHKTRRVCSGREWLPFLAMMGKVVAAKGGEGGCRLVDGPDGTPQEVSPVSNPTRAAAQPALLGADQGRIQGAAGDGPLL